MTCPPVDMCDAWTCSEIEIDRWNLLCEATTVAIDDDSENGEEISECCLLFVRSGAKRYIQRVR